MIAAAPTPPPGGHPTSATPPPTNSRVPSNPQSRRLLLLPSQRLRNQAQILLPVASAPAKGPAPYGAKGQIGDFPVDELAHKISGREMDSREPQNAPDLGIAPHAPSSALGTRNGALGTRAPWSSDRILQSYKFCQAYRVLDKGSQFLIREVIEKGSQKEDDMLFRILLYNTFNKNETYELFQRELCELTWASFDIAKYDAVLQKADGDARRRGDQFAPFTAAYQKVAPKFPGQTNAVRYLLLLEEMMEVLPPVLKNAKYAAEIFENIASLPGMGDFLSFQLFLCLSYSPLFHFSPNDFVVPGPGCSSGLLKMFGSSLLEAKLSVRGIESQILRWLVDNQCTQFKRLGIEFAFLRDASGAKIKLQLPDMEHAACETALRGKFSAPASDEEAEVRRLPKKPALPLAWAHPKRRVARIRKGPIVVDKMYSPVRIVRQRKVEGRPDGETVEYEIEWWGYATTSWEPRHQFSEDAPTMVAEWDTARSKKGKVYSR
ncbi:Chromo domain-containing protein [Mycena kentingensis (nom. inval.)]|nr:Chromo domain-containing protein [Mycena kentingensis (nom. inval.)]